MHRARAARKFLWTLGLGVLPMTVVAQPPAEIKGDVGKAAPPTSTTGEAGKSAPATSEATKAAPPEKGPSERPTGEKSASDKPAASAASMPKANQDGTLNFRFSNAEWETVLEWISRESGRTLNYTSTKRPQGQITYIDPASYKLGGAIDVLNLLLIPKGFILNRQYNFLNVIDYNATGGIPKQYIPRIRIDELAERGKTEIVMVMFKPNRLIAKNLADEYKDLLAPVGSLQALPSTNELLVTGTADMVAQVLALINAQDGPASNPPNFAAFPLKYIPAVDAERIVRNILGMPERGEAQKPASQNQSGGRGGRGGERFGMFFGGGPFPGGPQPPNPQQQQQTPQVDPNKGPFVAIDDRSNTLLLFATPDKIALAHQTLKELDTPLALGTAGESQTPRFEVYEVEGGTADGVSRAIGQVFDRSADTRVSAHPDGNHILVYATPREQTKVREIIAKMKGEGKKFVAIQLRERDAVLIAESLKQLLGQEEDENAGFRRFFSFGGDDEKQKKGPMIAPETTTNQLLVYGTDSQIMLVRELLVQLGEPSAMGDDANSKFRTLSIGDADPRELQRRLQENWKRLGNEGTLKIDVLAPPPVLRKQAEPSEPTEPRKGAPKSSEATKSSTTARNDSRVSPVSFASYVEPSPQDAPKSAPADKSKSALDITPRQAPGATELKSDKPADDNGEINIMFGPGGQTIIRADDPKKAEMAERMLRSMIEKGQPGMMVIKLKSADATDLAYAIDDLLYGDSQRGGGFGFFPFGGGGRDREKQVKARIVADTRMNALLVQGPPSEQKKVVELVKVLDDEAPDNDIAAEARPIPIKHARADRIAEQLRELYAPIVFQQQGGQRGGDQGGFGFGRFGGPFGGGPFGGFGGGGFGGGGGRNRSGSGGRGAGNAQQDAKGKITLSVDEVTNTIMVVAPKAIFEEVERVALALDEESAKTKQNVRVVTLKHGRSENVSKAMSELFGVEVKQSEDATGGRGRNGGGNNSQGGSQSPGGFGRFGGNFGGGGPGGGFGPAGGFGGDSGGGGGDRGGGGRRGRRGG